MGIPADSSSRDKNPGMRIQISIPGFSSRDENLNFLPVSSWRGSPGRYVARLESKRSREFGYRLFYQKEFDRVRYIGTLAERPLGDVLHSFSLELA